MKTIKMMLMALLFGFLSIANNNLYAQDPMKSANNVYKKLLLENDKVRVMQVIFAPAASAAWHSHPNHSVYVLSGGKIQITEKGKPANTMDIKAGTAIYMPAVTHMAKNIGQSTIKLIVTEMKPTHPKK